MDKYTMTEETIIIQGHKLFRIKRLSDGKLGGFIEYYSNLSQKGNCWVGDNAKVYGKNTLILDNAQVYDEALICGFSRVFDNAQVFGNAIVENYGMVYGNALVYGEAQIYDASVNGNARVCDKATIENGSYITGDAMVYGDASVDKRCNIMDKAKIYEDAHLSDNVLISDHARIFGNAYIHGRVEVDGETKICDDAEIYNHAQILLKERTIGGNIKIHGDLYIHEQNLKDTVPLKLDSGEITPDNIDKFIKINKLSNRHSFEEALEEVNKEFSNTKSKKATKPQNGEKKEQEKER